MKKYLFCISVFYEPSFLKNLEYRNDFLDFFIMFFFTKKHKSRKLFLIFLGKLQIYIHKLLVNRPFMSDIFFRNEKEIEWLIFLYQVFEKEGSLCNLDSQLTYILHGKFDTCLQFWCASIAFGIIELKSFKYLDSMYLGKVVTKCILLQVNTQKGQENIQNNV